MFSVDLSEISQNSSFKLDEILYFGNRPQNNDSDFINEENNSSINQNSQYENNQIKEKKNNAKIIFKTVKIENLSQIFTPRIPKLDNCDNDIIKETADETFNKEKNVKENNNIDDIISGKQKYKKKLIKSKSTKKKRNRKKNILRRKNNSDNIRRKIISKFFKDLIKNINKQLKQVNINKGFYLLSASFKYKFISEVINAKDKSKVDFTFGQLISKNILAVHEKKNFYKKNTEVLNLVKRSTLNNILNMKFSQLYKEYLESEEFNEEEFDKKEKNSDYINRCKKKAYEFLYFFKKY